MRPPLLSRGVQRRRQVLAGHCRFRRSPLGEAPGGGLRVLRALQVKMMKKKLINCIFPTSDVAQVLPEDRPPVPAVPLAGEAALQRGAVEEERVHVGPVGAGTSAGGSGQGRGARGAPRAGKRKEKLRNILLFGQKNPSIALKIRKAHTQPEICFRLQ